jgi:hypothetical protein
MEEIDKVIGDRKAPDFCKSLGKPLHTLHTQQHEIACEALLKGMKGFKKLFINPSWLFSLSYQIILIGD